MPKMLIPRWSMKYDQCIECGKTESRYEAKGFCQRCYNKKFMREKQYAFMREYRKTHPQKGYKTKTGFKYADAPTPRANKCEICLREGRTVLDHCHKSNKFRGWLCNQCNTSLGMVKDRIEILHKMIEYLVKNS